MTFPTAEILLLLLAAFSSCSGMDAQYDPNSPFFYDWHKLRVGGLVVAGILCLLGIIILLSGKCKCKVNRRDRHPAQVAPKLVPSGESTDC